MSLTFELHPSSDVLVHSKTSPTRANSTFTVCIVSSLDPLFCWVFLCIVIDDCFNKDLSYKKFRKELRNRRGGFTYRLT